MQTVEGKTKILTKYVCCVCDISLEWYNAIDRYIKLTGLSNSILVFFCDDCVKEYDFAIAADYLLEPKFMG